MLFPLAAPCNYSPSPFEILEGVFYLLSEEVHNVSEKARQDSKTVMAKIIDAIKQRLADTSSDVLMPSALRALASIAITLVPGEEHGLTSTVPLVIKCIQERRATVPGLAALLALT